MTTIYATAARGDTQVVVVQGEPGIGKTRLARDFGAWVAANGADVLQGRAFEAGGRLPYQPLVDALRPRLEHENAPEDLLGDVWLAELGRLLPELRERYPDLPVVAVDEAAARVRLFEAFARLGQALAQRAPVVVVIDDLQWADVGSLDAIQYVARRWTELRIPLLVLLSLRSEALATSPDLDGWMTTLPRVAAVTSLELGSLAYDATQRFVREVATGADATEIDAFARWLYAETTGQPLFVVETLRAPLDREVLMPRQAVHGRWTIELPPNWPEGYTFEGALPPGVRDVIRMRLGRLAPPARDLLSAGSVVGQNFTFPDLCSVAGLTEAEALPAIDQVLRVNMLREAGQADGQQPAGGYVFAHDKIRDVVYAEAGDARRRVFHRRALETLTVRAPAAQLAHHALAAPALRYSRAAGDEAVRLLAARDAVAYFARALAIADQLGLSDEVAELHASRGRALASLGQWIEARRELEAALDGLPADHADQRAAILLDLLEVCWWWLDVNVVRERAAELDSLADQLRRPELHSAALAWLSPTISADGDVQESVARYEREVLSGLEPGLALPPPVQAYMPVAYYWLGRLHEAVQHSKESIQAARAAHHSSATMFALPNLGMTLAACGRYSEGAEVFAEARQVGREYGIGTLLARAIAMSAGYFLDVNDLARNEAVAEEARELARSLDFAPPAISAGLDLLMNFARRHDVDRAESLIDDVAQSVARATAWHGWLWRIRLGQARGEIALARHDWPAALEWSRVTIDDSRARQRVKYEILGLHTRAMALQGLGRTRSAIEAQRLAVVRARSMGDPALFVRVAAGLLGLDGDDELASEATARAGHIAGALPDAGTRARFQSALPASFLT